MSRGEYRDIFGDPGETTKPLGWCGEIVKGFLLSLFGHGETASAEDGIRDRSPSRGLGDVYKRQSQIRFKIELAVSRGEHRDIFGDPGETTKPLGWPDETT